MPTEQGGNGLALAAILTAVGALIWKLYPVLQGWWEQRNKDRKIRYEIEKQRRSDSLEERERLLSLRVMEDKSAGPTEVLKFFIRKQDRENRLLREEMARQRGEYESQMEGIRTQLMNCITGHAKADGEISRLNMSLEIANEQIERLKSSLKASMPEEDNHYEQ
jgi:hypothetical protein